MTDLERWAPTVLAVLRIVTAVLFMEHGLQKFFDMPPRPEGMAAPEMFSLFWFGGLMELIGGGLLAIGLFTRPVAFLLSGEMAVAYWMFHATNGISPAVNRGDAAILFCFIFFYLVFAGPGRWSIDENRA